MPVPDVNDGSPSPLMLAWPVVSLTLAGELHADVDRLLTALLQLGWNDGLFRRGKGAAAATIGYDGRLRYVRNRLSVVWHDSAALAARLDELIARDRVRAVAQVERKTVRQSDGIHDWTYDAVHVLVEHRDRLSYDFFWPLAWGPVHRPDAHAPEAVDRVAAGYPHRTWPGVDTQDNEDLAAPVSSVRARELYMSEGDYAELHRAIAIADAELAAIGDDLAWAEAADSLASLLAARFRHAGDPEDIARAVRLGRDSAARSGREPLLCARYAALLGLRFVADGQLGILEQAVAEAKAVTSPDDVGPGTEIAEILGELLLARYRATAERKSLEEVRVGRYRAVPKLGLPPDDRTSALRRQADAPANPRESWDTALPGAPSLGSRSSTAPPDTARHDTA